MIPTFDCARYLEATLRSLLAQAPGPEAMQIEVVDDQSTTDDPAEVVTRLGGGRVDFYRQSENVGVVANLNTCLQRSRGEVVHLLHGDDVVLDGFYRTLGDRLREHPEAGAAYCRHVYVDARGRRLEVAPLEPAASGILAEGARFLAAEQRIMTPCIVVRRSVYEQLGGFDDRLACAEDWEMWVRIAARFPVYYEERPLACYRLHDDSNTGRNLRSGLSLDHTRLAIDLFADYFEPAERRAVKRAAFSRYAESAVETAWNFQSQGDTAAARAQLRVAWRLERSPRTAARIARVFCPLGRTEAAVRRIDARARWEPPVRVALVGCGAVARTYYAPALARLMACRRVETVRLFDPSPARVRDVTRLLPATVAPSWEAVLEGPDELAIVASPPVAHSQQVQALLEHGKHVLCEKPFSLDRAEAESLADLGRERGLACAVGMVRRFSRSACLLRRLLSEERPTRLVWHEGGPFRWPVASPAYFAPEAGNSVLWDLGSHVLDLLIWWLGAPDALSCRDDAMGGTAANCVLELAWADGCCGEVRLSREYDLPGGLVVERTSGDLVCRDVTEADVLYASGESAPPDFQQEIPGSPAPAGETFLDCFDLQLRNVLAAVRHAAPLWVPAEDVIESVGTLAVAEAEGVLLESPWLGRRELGAARAARAGAREVARC
jgi:predicted dehydrogenase